MEQLTRKSKEFQLKSFFFSIALNAHAGAELPGWGSQTVTSRLLLALIVSVIVSSVYMRNYQIKVFRKDYC